MPFRSCLLTGVILTLSILPRYGLAEITVEKTEGGAEVRIDGELFTEYLIQAGPKPILWPIIGPTGQEMTRAYPMRPDVEGEKQDHPHQRSFWFTHGNVNGVDFWSELEGHGDIVHREFVSLEGGESALIVTDNEWLGPDGTRQLADRRELKFRAGEGWRSIDFDIRLFAVEGPVTFGDTKEGTFGVRIPTSLDTNSNLGGRILNSDGLQDDAAWGKPAAWVDYSGPLQDETVGIAILNHPTSFRYPTHWHVRNYGLFAANPFGLHDFSGSADVDGAYTLPVGESLLLRYRVIFHRGDAESAQLAESFSAYADEP